MARSVFFSFDYSDVSSFRANVVRNSWLTMRDAEAKFIDRSMWEAAESKGTNALKNLIEAGMKGTSVTVVLVGTNTANRGWVKYEMIKSFLTGKGILPIYINRIPSKFGDIKAKGVNPLDRLAVDVSEDCKKLTFYHLMDRKWVLFDRLSNDNNRTTNSFYFEDGWFNKYKGGKAYKFSDLFKIGYDWGLDDGYKNFNKWIENAANLVGR